MKAAIWFLLAAMMLFEVFCPFWRNRASNLSPPHRRDAPRGHVDRMQTCKDQLVDKFKSDGFKYAHFSDIHKTRHGFTMTILFVGKRMSNKLYECKDWDRTSGKYAVLLRHD